MELEKIKQRIDYQFSSQKIPYALLDFAVKHNRFTSVQIFVLVKFLYKDKFFDKDVKNIATILGLTTKTVWKHIDWLDETDWIKRNSQEGVFHVRKWDFIRTLLKSFSRSGYLFYMKRLPTFKAFAIAATYDHLIRLQKYKIWHGHRESAKKGRSMQTGVSANGYYPVANSAYAIIFGVSESTASRYRELARRAKYIQTKETFEKLTITTVSKADSAYYKAEFGKQIVYRKKAYFVQDTTVVRSHLEHIITRFPGGKFCKHNKGILEKGK